jgi:photosystem II stability/assembly factor-like uncharacterized protein
MNLRTLTARHLSAAMAVCAIAATAALAAVDIDSSTFGGLTARPIGPAIMSGRIAALDATATHPHTVYAGTATGGLWKSTDAGITFKPVFDDHNQSIGAVRIDPSNHDTVWVGTGETWTRNSVSVGDGVYRTDDGGDNWKKMGLEDTERIVKIHVHPSDSDTVYVCATGHLWDANEERGVFKTTDGGENWTKILYVDENTGCSDLAMDPQDPDILYAGMWQFRRYPDFFESGGPGSGLYKSTDGGESWTELRDGLPEGTLGRVAVEVAPSRPSTVYAVVEAKEKTALYRSQDLGATWEERNSAMNVAMRPFYFALVVVDPKDHDIVYKPGLTLSVSRDGGKAFTSPFGGGFGGSVHSDLHALWVNPDNPLELILGTDGGVYQSFNRGSTWRHVGTLPVSQFYQVGYDMEFPYRVYGGLQDNGSWMGPSRSPGGIGAGDWKMLGGGDGFHAYPDFFDPKFAYVEYQGGNISRVNLETEEAKDIKPVARGEEEELRFNWNSPITVSRLTEGTIYFGSQYVHRSRDRGETWETISPDLTTDDPQRQRQLESGGLTIDNSTAENNTTVFSIAESPLDGDVLWVGTDDGNVQVTRDGGGSWTNVVGNIPGIGEGTWISQVEASPHDKATAFVTVDDHRRGDMSTHVYKTTDYGATWTSIVGSGLEGFAHVVRQDPVNPDLLFVGTEFGLYLSLDGGQQWARFTGRMPRVPVHDIQIHPREHDLIVGTHGRGIYILDDLTPLRALTPEVLESDIALLPSRPAVMMIGGMGGWFGGDAEYTGPNPPEAATIYYYQKKRHLFGDLNVEVYDQDGEPIITLPAPKRKGINRVTWPMRLKPPKLPPATNLVFAFSGPRVPEGSYDFKLTKGKKTLEGQVELVRDPRSPHSDEDRALQQKTALHVYGLLSDLTYVVETLIDLADQAKARAEEAGEDSAVGKNATEYVEQLDALRESMVSTAEAGWLSGDEKLREKLGNVFGSINNYEGRPTGSQLEQAEQLEAQLKDKTAEFEELTGDPLDKLNAQLDKKKLDPIVMKSREAWESGDEESSSSSLLGVTKKEFRRWAAAEGTLY